MANNCTNNSLIVLLWNWNGILNHINGLTETIHKKIIDLILISESHLTDRAKLNISSYHLITSNQLDGTAYAGFAILIRTHIQLYALPNYNKNYIQSCAISMTLNHLPLTIATALLNITSQQTNSSFSSNILVTKFIVGGILMRNISTRTAELVTPGVLIFFILSPLNYFEFMHLLT